MDSTERMPKLTLEQLLKNASEAPTPRRSAKFWPKKLQKPLDILSPTPHPSIETSFGASASKKPAIICSSLDHSIIVSAEALETGVESQNSVGLDGMNNEELTTSDEEILNLGQDCHNTWEDPQASSYSPKQSQDLKHAREGGLMSSPDPSLAEYQLHSDTDEGSPNKRQRSDHATQKRKTACKQSSVCVNNQKSKASTSNSNLLEGNPRTKRKVRRLPVNELIITERLDTLEQKQDETVNSQDPIVDSQINKQILSRDKKATPRKPLKDLSSISQLRKFGLVNISDYRIPKAKDLSPKAKLRMRSSPTYSEGFEGDEAKPTGRLIPSKHIGRRQYTDLKVAAKMGKLMLISNSKEGSLNDDVCLASVMNKNNQEMQKVKLHNPPTNNNEGDVMELVEIVSGRGASSDDKCPTLDPALERLAKRGTSRSRAEDGSPTSKPSKAISSLRNSEQDLRHRLKRSVSFNDSVDVQSQFMMVSMPGTGREYDTEEHTEAESSQSISNESLLPDNASAGEEKQDIVSEDEKEETFDDNSVAASAVPQDALEPIDYQSRWHQTYDTILCNLQVSSSEMEAVTLRNTELNKDIPLTPGPQDDSNIKAQLCVSVDTTSSKRIFKKVRAITSKAVEWINTREPSGYAFEQYRKSEFKKAQVEFDDPRAAFKLNVSTTKVPESAIKPGGWISDPSTPPKSFQMSPGVDKASPINIWRPRVPTSSNLPIEVDEDIFDRTPTKPPSSKELEAKHSLKNDKRSVRMGILNPPGLHREEAFFSPSSSQISVMLGSTQLSCRGIPESQMSYQNSISEESLQSCDYSTFSEQSLQEFRYLVTKPPNAMRSRSMPTSDIRDSAMHRVSSSLQDQNFHLTVPPRAYRQARGSSSRNKNSVALLQTNVETSRVPNPTNSRAKSLPFIPPFRHAQA